LRLRFISGVPVLALAYGVTAAATFLLSVLVGHALGAAALGVFSFGVSVARIFFASADLGVASHLTRIVSRDRAAATRVAPLFFGFRVAMIPLAVVITTVIGVTAGPGAAPVYSLVAIAIGSLTLQQLYEALLLSFQRTRTVAILNVVGACCIAGAALVWFVIGGSLTAFAIAYAVASVAALFAWHYAAGRDLKLSLHWRLAPAEVRGELRHAWPIGLSNLLGIAALKSPVIVLGLLSTANDVGTFSAVDVFVTASAILQTAVSSATFPQLAAAHRSDHDRFRRWFWSSNALLLVAGVIVGAALVLFGADIASLAFPGKDFSKIGELMPIIGLSTPALLLVHHNIVVFAAVDKERANLLLMVGWFVAIIAFQAALVPSYGVVGAVWGVLLGRVIGLAVIAGALFRTGLLRR
jgi:stage V sporulation protein B